MRWSQFLRTVLSARRRHLCSQLLGSGVLGITLLASAGDQIGAPVTPTAEAPAGIWAELQGRITPDLLNRNDPILAKVTHNWMTKDCSLARGSILQGRVVESHQRSTTSRFTDVALSFEATCSEGQSIPLLLFAVLKPVNGQQSPESIATSLPLSMGGGLRNISDVTDMARTPIEDNRDNLPTTVKPGQVWGISHVNLSVATGPKGSSVLSTPARGLRLAFGTNLVFFPAPQPDVVATVKPGQSFPRSSGTAPAESERLAEVADETELCSPPACSQALDESALPDGPVHARARMSVAGLGYAPRVTRELGALDHDAAIAYLGSSQLLFTFNPHRLVPRSKQDRDDVARVVRAVLIDLDTKRVTHTVEWRVPDSGQYLWPVAADHVVVHIGNELRMYGPGLTLERKLAIDGKLNFLRAAPDGKTIAIGIVRERHTSNIHRQLEEATSMPPEEDVAVLVLDRSFTRLGEQMRTSTAAPPALTNRGELRVMPDGHQHWLIEEQTWDRHTRKIARVGSSCEVTAAALRSDLIFLRGCEVNVGKRWYRAVRMDGHAVLKGSVDLHDVENSVVASEAGATFVMAVAKANTSVISGTSFHGLDLISESFGVYSAADGKRILSLGIAAPAPTRQIFTLSPAGDRLAVLQGNEIFLYGLPLRQAATQPMQ